MDKQKGIFYTIVSAASFGLTPLLCSYAYKAGATPETLVFLRNLFVVPVLFAILKVKKIDLALDASTMFKAFLVGIFGMTATALLLYNAYEYLPVGTVTTVHFLYPVFVSLIGLICFKEKIPMVKAIVLTIATCGVFFFLETGGDISTNNLIIGLILSIASGATYAFYMVGIERFGLNKINSYKLTFYLSIFSCIVMLIYAVATGKFTMFEMAPIGFAYAFVIAMGTSFLAVYTLQLGIKYLGASTAAIFCMFEPVTAVIGGIIVLGESVTLMKVIGCVVILGSVTLLTILDKKNETKNS
ncbi:MAG: DMT family transporter [Erysipelotrichaceae bacterium]|nr:DMT family transporter [Erysipelotrichaceae bacterium]MDY5252872.1 DMT family transporter [Erysipelotrichaceae bacterium]